MRTAAAEAETEIPYLGLEACQEFQVLWFGKNSGSITHRGCVHHLNMKHRQNNKEKKSDFHVIIMFISTDFYSQNSNTNDSPAFKSVI